MKAAIIESYTWEDSMTDMECAWGLGYTLINVETYETTTVRVGTGWGQKFEDVCDAEIVPLTDEIKEAYRLKRDAEREVEIKCLYEKFKVEVDEYNATNRVQKTGQVVSIKKGKYRGHSGTVTWIGKSKFNKSYGNRYQSWKVAAIIGTCNMRPYTIPAKEFDLVLVREGDFKAYVPIDYCEVTEGFVPVSFTLDDVRNYCKCQDSNWQALSNTYDRKSYVD